ncbi:MAG: SHOCT domain-containing protein [Nakamurella multipartita]|jgi:hypothetical protein
MGLLGMMARTAVVAGTATAVSNRVSRRQVNRWNQKAEAQEYEQQQSAPEQQPQYQDPQYQQQPQYQQPQYQQPQYQQPAPPAAAPAGGSNIADEIQRLASLKEQGILSDDEFAAAKAKLLGI